MHMTPNPDNQTAKKAVDPGKSIHLSASAGSGKTRALKDRYLALLDVLDRRGLNIDQAVAITFTDKAAAEIKERVLNGLPEDMLKKIIRGRQDLRISTIHSFCMNLLKRYPLEAGLPPDFGVLDVRDQAYKIEKAIEDALEDRGRDAELMGPLSCYTVDELVGIVGFLLSIRSKLKRMEIDAGGPEALLRAVQTGMGLEAADRELRTLVASPEWRTLFTHMEQVLRSQGAFYEDCCGAAHSILAAAEDRELAARGAEALLPVYFTQKGEPRKKPPISRGKYGASKDVPYADYEALAFRVQEVLSRFFSARKRLHAGREAASLLRIYQRADENYQESKLREGLLDFDDLEIYAYRLLQARESPDILYWLDRKILHFLVDEFQDTSDIQWAVLNKLTEELFAGQGADKPVRPTLFVVGDEKQSIYRFREANYRLIELVQKRMEEGLLPEAREILTLDTNFRSAPEVVGLVNRVFTALWGEAYKPSRAARAGHTGSVRLIELAPDAGKDAGGEAAALAGELKALIEQGTTIYDKTPDAGLRENDGWTSRPAEYGDCAILIQTRSRLKEYEAALQAADIPFRVVGGIGFYDEDEIQALIGILFFLWNREDRLSLAAALKSPLFGFTDQSLFELMQEDGDLVSALKDRKPGVWNLLHGWMSIAGLVPLAGLIHRIVAETGAYVRFGRQSAQAIFNIDKLLDTALEFDRRGHTTLQDFVEWVKSIREAEQREAAADMNLPGFRGAVSIMTVHKAKGLEYPVVFLPGMNQQPRAVTTGPRALIESDGAVRMAVRDAGSPAYDELWSREREELRREHQRLFYVAMTRARDHLVMIAALGDEAKPVKRNSWLEYLHEAAAETLFAPPEEAQAAPQAPSGDRGSGEGAEPAPAERIDAQLIAQNLAPIAAPASPEWKRATDFLEHEKEPAFEPSVPPALDAVSPLIRGTVLHRCLEEFSKEGSYSLERIISDFPGFPALGKDARARFLNDARSVLDRVLTERAFAWIFEQTEKAYSELPFLYKRGNTLVSGIIDRVVIRDNRAQVIDYKAILAENDESLAAWKEHYRPQLRIYCEAMKEMFRLPEAEGYLLFLDSARLELTIKV